MQSLVEVDGRILTPARFDGEIVAGCKPVVIRGLVRNWPVVAAALQSPQTFREYLRRFDNGGQMDVFFGDRQIAGKYYYGQDLGGFNFERRRMTLASALDTIIATLDDDTAETVYAGSIPLPDYLPGLDQDNSLSVLPKSVTGRIWLGHASNVSPHYDTLDNLACVVAGHRRFTLYAPELIGSLYVGPIDHTMAGQPVSLAASAPDPVKYPLFEAVKDQAFIVELDPGDALYLPKLWWHKVEGLAPFNGLVNYWWDAFSAGPDAPYTTLLLAMIAIAERPEPERQAWNALFDHYVFRAQGHPLAHLPPEQHGLLGPLRLNYGKIRARVMNILRGG